MSAKGADVKLIFKMRKSILIFSALCASAVAFGQLKMYSDGKVVINPSGSFPAQLTVNTITTQGLYVGTFPKNSIKGNISGIEGCSSGVVTFIPKDIPYSAGVIGRSGLKTGSDVTSFGVFGQGNGNAQGRNIGVFGFLDGGVLFETPTTTNGAGVFGATNFNQSARFFNHAYAGFFAGDVKITNQLDVVGTAFPADYNYFQDIADIEREIARRLHQLNPVTYKLKQRYTEYTDSLGNNVKLGEFDEKSQLFTNTHYGLLAQDVQRFFPDLVYKNENGDLSVDYVALIPLLITAIKDVKKEFRTEIDSIKDSYAAIDQRNNAPGRPPQETQGFAVEAAALFQNTPNPFTENTEIAFYLPQSVTNAMLCIYDMNGRQLSQDIINARGNATFIVNGNHYGAGMYLYSLIADNQIVDTKRMILTR